AFFFLTLSRRDKRDILTPSLKTLPRLAATGRPQSRRFHEKLITTQPGVADFGRRPPHVVLPHAEYSHTRKKTLYVFPHRASGFITTPCYPDVLAELTPSSAFAGPLPA